MLAVGKVERTFCARVSSPFNDRHFIASLSSLSPAAGDVSAPHQIALLARDLCEV